MSILFLFPVFLPQLAGLAAPFLYLLRVPLVFGGGSKKRVIASWDASETRAGCYGPRGYGLKGTSGVAWSLDDKLAIRADGGCSTFSRGTGLVSWLLPSRSGRGSLSLGFGLYIVVHGMTAVLQATDILRKDRGIASMDDNAIKYYPLLPGTHSVLIPLPLSAVSPPRARTGRRNTWRLPIC